MHPTQMKDLHNLWDSPLCSEDPNSGSDFDDVNIALHKWNCPYHTLSRASLVIYWWYSEREMGSWRLDVFCLISHCLMIHLCGMEFECADKAASITDMEYASGVLNKSESQIKLWKQK